METTKREIILDAQVGANISECLDELIVMCVSEETKVTLVFNETGYSLDIKDIKKAIKEKKNYDG